MSTTPWLNNNYFGFGSADAYQKAIQEKIGPNQDWSKLSNPNEARAFMSQRKNTGQAPGATGLFSQLTPDAFSAYAEIASQLLQPMHDSRRAALSTNLNAIQTQAQGLRRIAEASHAQARHNLTGQERTHWNRMSKMSDARGIGTSPLAAYQQRQVAEAYAPEYQQLEAQGAAQLGNIAGQAAIGSEQIANQKRELEAQLAGNLAQIAHRMYTDDRARTDNLDQQGWDRGLQMFDRTTMTPSQQWEAYLRGGEVFGQSLGGMPDQFGRVPAQTTPAPATTPARPAQTTTTNTTPYTIAPGDTLGALARRFGTTIQALMRLNPQITDPNKIFVGTKLNVPAR